MDPNAQQSPDGRAAAKITEMYDGTWQAGCNSPAGSKETAPVVADGKVNRSYLDREEDSTDRRTSNRRVAVSEAVAERQNSLEGGRNTDGSGCGQHLAGPGLVLVNVVEGSDEFAEESGHNAGNVDEGSFFP